MTDIDCVRLAATDPSIPKGTTVPATFSPDAAQAFVTRQWERSESGAGISFAITLLDSDTAVGITTLLRHFKYDCVYEIGYWLIPGARGSGLATRAVRLASKWAISLKHVERVEAYVDITNSASIRTLLKADFQQEGVLRRYLKFDDTVSDCAVLSIVKA